ncbi:hypothetical protein Syun_004086 [Stephania yunnanensis]|uniref:Uncharacterized protein n=1 Tax=Stephania yunnanensis TaxID=152371 RepID=A0AAP0L6I2_9MAGN
MEWCLLMNVRKVSLICDTTWTLINGHNSGVIWTIRLARTREPRKYDIYGWWLYKAKIGGSTFDSSGRRHSAADLFSYAKASNIRVAVSPVSKNLLVAD